MKTINKVYQSKNDLKHFIASNNIKGFKNILLQIFIGVCDMKFIEELVSTIKTLVPHIKIIGTTTGGEICNDEVFENSTILAFSFFESTTIKTYFATNGKDSNETAQKLISQFPKDTPKVVISFADGLHTNGEEFLKAFHSYNDRLIVSGGLAGDNAKFAKTFVFNEEKILDNGAVVALLFNDDLIVKTKASFGWENVGKTMTITKSYKNIVYEIDGIKAVDIYAKYLGDEAANYLPKLGIEFPLIAIRGNLKIPRAVLSKGEDGSLTCAGNLSVGDKVTFGYGNIDSILDYSEHLGEIRDSTGSESIFIYSCMARKSLMQENIKIELLPLSEIAQTSGFFTYGEFFTDETTSSFELLNQTMTILSLSENVTKTSIKRSKQERTNAIKIKEISLTLRALSHLTHHTSKELEQINSSLAKRVQEEVEKSRQKDQAMLNQTKLAQMGEMISMIAHQWRQPLSAISATANDLTMKMMFDKYNKDYFSHKLANITNLSQHLSRTINDFRNFYKEDKYMEEALYTNIVKNALNIVWVSTKNKNIKLTTEFNCDKKVYVYPNELQQVVLNLIKNAEDALLENNIKEPYIHIKTYHDKDYAYLEISDNGGGVKENIVDKIFEPYFSTKRQKDGTGLGLYMSKIIVEDHCKGKLTVSNGKDGAVFKIALPVIGGVL